MAAVGELQRLRDRIRRSRSENERGQVDRHPCGPDFRFALAASRLRRSLCMCGLKGKVRERLCGGVDQSNEPRSLRRRLALRGIGPSNSYRPVPRSLDENLDLFSRLKSGCLRSAIPLTERASDLYRPVWLVAIIHEIASFTGREEPNGCPPVSGITAT